MPLRAEPANTPTRCCTECGQGKPWTPANFPKVKGSDQLQLICRSCRRKKSTRVKLDKLERQAVERYVMRASAGGSTIPHSAEVLESIVNLFGGSDGLASVMVKQYYDAPPGGRIRSQTLEMITRLTLKNTELGGAKRPLTMYTEDELNAELENKIRQVAVIEGTFHALPAPEVEYTEAGQLCTGADAPNPERVDVPKNGVSSPLFADPTAMGLPHGPSE